MCVCLYVCVCDVCPEWQSTAAVVWECSLIGLNCNRELRNGEINKRKKKELEGWGMGKGKER